MRLTKIAISAVTICLALCLTLGLTLGSIVNAAEINSATKAPDCLNIDKEIEKQQSMFTDGIINIAVDQPLEIVFDDGSSIKYVVSEENTLGVELITPYSVSHTYSVQKIYFYGSGSATIKLYADLEWGVPTSRSVTMNREWTSLTGTWASFSDTGELIVQQVATTNGYAIAETWGTFTLHAPELGDYFTRNFRIQLLADPANSSGVIMRDLLQ